MLSIIVPAYNAENTIKQSINNLLDNDCFEIIIIENGSTDKTTDVVEEVVDKHSNVKLLHSTPGVSNARNCGIELASGDYIAFLDADDYYEVNTLIEFYSRAKKDGYDILMGAYSRDYANLKEKHYYYNEEKVFNSSNIDEFVRDTLIPEKGVGLVWGKVIKTSLLKNKELVFNPKLSFAEDAEMMFRTAIKSRKIGYIPEILYHYTFNPNSAVRKYKEDLDQRYILAMRAVLSDIRNTENGDKYLESYYTFVNNHLLIIAVNFSFSPFNGKKYQVNKNEFRKLCQEDVFKLGLEHPNYKKLSKSRAIPLFFVKHHLYYLMYLVVRFRHKQFKKRNEESV